MRAFISYSINDHELQVISLLSSELAKKGISTHASFKQLKPDHSLPQDSVTLLHQSNLFIGVISAYGMQNEKVMQEWRYAAQLKIPALLLVEDNFATEQHPNIIYFNRVNSAPAVTWIKQKLGMQPPTPFATKDNETGDVWAWILGGAAVLGTVLLFSSLGKK